MREHRFREYAYEPVSTYIHAYTPEETAFRVHAPLADVVSIDLQDRSGATRRHAMDKTKNGDFTAVVSGDLEGWRYRYRARFGKKTVVTIDPYAVASSPNATHSVVVDPKKFYPMRHRRPHFSGSLTDAVIYESSVRDMTSKLSTGDVAASTYPAAALRDLKTPKGRPAAFDHIVSLGVTHVQFLPLNDFAGLDETHPRAQYNWGYNPVQYFVPEGSYSTAPADPYARINELRAMIDAYHAAGLRVIVDGVFNHVYDAKTFSLQHLHPEGVFRRDENGALRNDSGCQNDLASENPLVRAFIVDAVRHWVRTYRIDGFRLDLMGLLDLETVKAVKAVLDDEGEGLLLYGEGWMHDTPLDARLAHMYNAAQLPDIAFFNDRFRDTIKGSTFVLSDRGFAAGGARDLEELRRSVCAHVSEPPLFKTPSQSLNYVSCHDNHTLHDKLLRAAPNVSAATRKRYQLLATAFVLLSQGVPFLHMGQECLRTKNGDANSYRSGDALNGIDWSLVDEHADLVEAVKTLIDIRKTHDAFRLDTTAAVLDNLDVSLTKKGTLIVTIDGGRDRYRILFKPRKHAETLTFNDAFDILYSNGTTHATEKGLHLRSLAVVVLCSRPEEAH